jgi:hypothetical protein
MTVLTFIISTISMRVTQFMDSKIRNDNRECNLDFLINEMFLLMRYSKTTNLTDRDICVPAFFPELLKDLMVEVLAGGLRDCQELLSRVLWGEESRNYHKYVGHHRLRSTA